ncbi:MAG TPA: hypothetical protein VF179_17830 [Thermoanaerobaculia bacterium]|nr:hypothetical protein [Thermoanaerobaculia bacterium]
MSESLRSWLAVVIAPLVIVAWFLWPLIPFDHSPGEVARSVATAYALFFLSRGLAFLAYSGSRPAVHLAFVFLFAFLISFAVSIGLQDPFSSAATGALQDALWCTVAAAIYAALPKPKGTRGIRAVGGA